MARPLSVSGPIEPNTREPAALSILATISGPADLKRLSDVELVQLCAEIRTAIIETVAKTGGHLGSSLGVVELTVALHRLLDSPTDRIVWDTGHQAYPHKLLTGRFARFGTLRQLGGIGGFPRRSESPHDVFDGGHAGTGLSIGEGLAIARDGRGRAERIAVVVGDAAVITGLSIEALNDIGHRGLRLLIVLNDNEMSISPSVGALSTYLWRIKLSGTWRGSKRAYDHLVERIPVIGPTVLELSRRLRASVVRFAQPGQLFEDLGITYVGPVPGHDLRALDATLRRALEQEGPVLVHVRTQKGKGYRPAEADQVSFHGAALPPMALPGNGSDGDATLSAAQAAAAKGRPPNYTAVVSGELIAIAEEDPRVVAITAGMPPPPPPHPRPRPGGPAALRGRPPPPPPGGLRPGRPRRLPERPAGRHRGRPGRPGRRGRHEPPGHVHDRRPASDPQPRRGLAEGRTGGPPAAAHGLRAGAPLCAALPA